MTGYSSDPKERARELVAAGKIGGAKYGRMGGRPRVRRASEIAAHEAAEHAEEIVEALRAALDPSNPPHTRVAAATVWLAIEARVMKEAKGVPTFEHVSTQNLIDYVVARLAVIASAGERDPDNPGLPSVTS